MDGKDVSGEWLSSLREFTLGHTFNQCIGNVSWPKGLRTLRFGNSFDKPLECPASSWPSGLEEISFGRNFNQPLEKVISLGD